ncbi:hypothetical protein PDO_4463 [Rhizobium sp. PDO1-076]|uniref:hypothetical protein n=1 Tax=Rhizobium sp. PDO1-076 TaxID=1125979 RepID=UPI00024E2AEE|nr:hypothetical protein [Rhizobium sp. PDO1-076]EHS53028.1 hypothetical protein PDO_4463 [Rhizobium sp. PDO1-076]
MQELSISEALKDPLIRQMLRADKISVDTFAQLLAKAAKERRNRLAYIDWNPRQVGPGFLRQAPPPAE